MVSASPYWQLISQFFSSDQASILIWQNGQSITSPASMYTPACCKGYLKGFGLSLPYLGQPVCIVQGKHYIKLNKTVI